MHRVWFILLGIGAASATGAMLRARARRVRRERARKSPLPAAAREIIERNVPLYRRLPATLRDELHGHIQVFLAEKNFEGCSGQEITEEIKLTIAAQACLLLLNGRRDCYPRLCSILVYPSAYIATSRQRIGLGNYEERKEPRWGESWHSGAVVLAWDGVVGGTMDVNDGQNLVLHEFAHQLDHESGAADGAPLLERRSRYVTWARVLSAEYENLQRLAELGQPAVMHAYGATNPAEFFAVATETFFEKPKQMLAKHPELYTELKSYYRLDPAAWE